MFLKATLQKESPNQSLPKVSSEHSHKKYVQKQAYADVLQNRFRNFPTFTGKHLSWLESLFNKVAGLLQHLCFLVNIAKFSDSKSPVASVDILFLIKSNVGWFLLKRVDLVIVRVIYTH